MSQTRPCLQHQREKADGTDDTDRPIGHTQYHEALALVIVGTLAKVGENEPDDLIDHKGKDEASQQSKNAQSKKQSIHNH